MGSIPLYRLVKLKNCSDKFKRKLKIVLFAFESDLHLFIDFNGIWFNLKHIFNRLSDDEKLRFFSKKLNLA
jgi:hypothetical protein